MSLAKASSHAVLERQDMLALPIDDAPGDRTLAPDGVDRHDRALDLQLVQKLGSRDDVIGKILEKT